MNKSKNIFFCFASDRDPNGKTNKFFILVAKLKNDTELAGIEILGAMTAEEIYNKGIVPDNLVFSKKNGRICAEFKGFASRYPSVYQDDSGIHLNLKAFTSQFHRLNPKRLWPSKPELMRTLTVIGETRSEAQRYINYWMTNRKMLIRDKKYIQYGYYVCDYNGSVSYLTFEKIQAIGNRYGFTNAKIYKNRIVKDDDSDSKFLRLDPPSESMMNFFESADYLGEESIRDFEIKILRFYADTFFVLRRRGLSFSEGTIEEKKAVEEFRGSIEAFHQSLIHSSVPRNTYLKIQNKINELFNGDSDSKYKKMKKELLSRIPCLYFRETEAFDVMLEKRGSMLKKIVTLQTFADLSPSITEQYCAIMLAEQEISRELVSLGKTLGFMLIGFDYRLKSPDSLYDKLYERTNDTGLTTDQIFKRTGDILRYTVCFENTDDYCDGIKKVLWHINEKYSGQLEYFRNYWTPYVSGDYKGINACVRLPDVNWDIRENKIKSSESDGSRYCIKIPSFCFEIQFHTRESFEIKETNHILYEKCRRKDIPQSDKEECEKIMKSNMQKITAPDGVEFLDLVSNEYIVALRDCIQLMKSEIRYIKKCEKNNPFVDISLCD